MHILLEEVPLLVYYFGTLFLSNYKLRLILSIFWTTSTFCQLALTCSLTSFARLLSAPFASLQSLCRSLAHSLRSFARSLSAPFGHSAPFSCSLHSLHSRFALTCSLRSLVRSLRSLMLALP